MTESELIAWMFSAALGGAVLGATAAVFMMALRRRRDLIRQKEEARAVSWLGWLAAHRAVHRAARSLVWTFRSAKSDSNGWVKDAMRAWECLRARERYQEACDALDRAECALLPHIEGPDAASMGRSCVCQAEAMRLAIEGSAAELARWGRQMQDCASEAEAMALQGAQPDGNYVWSNGHPAKLMRLAQKAVVHMLDRWSEPPPAA